MHQLICIRNVCQSNFRLAGLVSTTGLHSTQNQREHSAACDVCLVPRLIWMPSLWAGLTRPVVLAAYTAIGGTEGHAAQTMNFSRGLFLCVCVCVCKLWWGGVLTLVVQWPPTLQRGMWDVCIWWVWEHNGGFSFFNLCSRDPLPLHAMKCKL